MFSAFRVTVLQGDDGLRSATEQTRDDAVGGLGEGGPCPDIEVKGRQCLQHEIALGNERCHKTLVRIRALPFAQKAIKLVPEQWTYLNTLGVVYYRLGQYPQAIEQLEHSLRVSKGEAAAFDLFFLAMCHARQGDAARAKDCYDRAVHWAQGQQGKLQPGWQEELEAFRAEADAMLMKH
jgi:tetratricopeptide (TPR) repeat protein